ncbi:HAMP domain-containing methyl-accepting chemotaxis protein [Telmatospirillum sp.]|uniref:methyl-accepting chemotaxis protein n=1 Tax=Telmatospirillum sp. TaxID=2079197 RepID=UPI00284ED395|nr:HAMP domain-containing methyl-accepting chemotaxis protein [Telmatospirillum sp.]MDR3437782.1 HAMP domain-containing methyl-accepting chemotaxis protein [Telmatospirillum sp.]
MFHTSIERLLLSAQWVLTLVLVTTLSITAWNAWNSYQAASHTLRLAHLDQALFQTTVAMRSQIPKVQTELLSSDQPMPVIAKAAEEAGNNLHMVFDALAHSGLPHADSIGLGLGVAERAMHDRQTEIERLANISRARRDIRETEPWRQAVYQVIDQLNRASIASGNAVRLTDPVLAEMVQVRREAWIIRDDYGTQCSNLRPNIASGDRPSAAQIASLAAHRAIYENGFASLGELLDRPGVSATVTEIVTTSRQEVAVAQKTIDKLVAGLDGSGNPALPAPEWTKLCNGPFADLQNIGFVALDEAARHADDLEMKAEWALVLCLGVLVVTLAAAALLAVTTHRRLSQPLRSLSEAVDRLSSGRLSDPVETAPCPDEFGAMSNALELLRKKALDAQRLREDMDHRQQDDRHRAKLIESACNHFAEAGAKTLGGIEAETIRVRQNAQTLLEQSSTASNQAKTAAQSAVEMSSNVQTVAAATEQLSGSIRTVSASAASGATQTRQAQAKVRSITTIVGALSDTTQRIGDIASFIQSIAQQTNLLALNATIEAARAGDAGKGFAVVASEVKALATQTAKATEDIGRQISDVQTSTEAAVDAIGDIVRFVDEIDRTTAAIAASVDEQGTVTVDISRNAHQASDGTQDVTASMRGIAQTNADIQSIADDMNEAVGDLSREQETLRDAIESFIANVQRLERSSAEPTPG